ncbi:MAG: hypothetical protein ACJ8FY_26110 [Gemmataceae bacterium]
MSYILSSRCDRSIALPLAASLGLHGLLGGLIFWMAAGTIPSSDRPLGIDTVVSDSGTEEGVFTLVEPKAFQPANGGAEESSSEPSFVQQVRINDLPAYEEQKDHGPVLSPSVRGHEGTDANNEHPDRVPNPGGASSDSQSPSATGSKKSCFPRGAAHASVVYLIDQSISMGLNGALEKAKREVILCIDSLPDTARFQVIFYTNHRIDPLKSSHGIALLHATLEAKEIAKDAIVRQRARDGTEHLEALLAALHLEPDMIVLVTDADDLSPEVVKRITSLNQQNCVIHTVELASAGEANDKGPLAQLAAKNRGTYRRLK